MLTSTGKEAGAKGETKKETRSERHALDFKRERCLPPLFSFPSTAVAFERLCPSLKELAFTARALLARGFRGSLGGGRRGVPAFSRFVHEGDGGTFAPKASGSSDAVQ